MRVSSIALYPYALPLVRPWAGAEGVMDMRRGTLIAVSTAEGVTGWGDCAPLPSHDSPMQARILEALKAACADAVNRQCQDVLTALTSCPNAQVRWSLETALLDAKAREQGVALRELLTANSSSLVGVNAALGLLNEGCLARAGQALAAGFQIAKIKVGVADPDFESEMLRGLVSVTSGKLRLRLDANRAWSGPQANGFLHQITDLPIDGVEEPLAEPTLDALGRLQAGLPFPLAVDESLGFFGAEAFLEQCPVRRLVMKPARIGSFFTVLALAERAAARGVDIVLTSVIDTTVGVVAAAQLAAALPYPQAHGLATLSWLAQDVAEAPSIENGHLILPDGAGLGIVPGREITQSPSIRFAVR